MLFSLPALHDDHDRPRANYIYVCINEGVGIYSYMFFIVRALHVRINKQFEIYIHTCFFIYLPCTTITYGRAQAIYMYV